MATGLLTENLTGIIDNDVLVSFFSKLQLTSVQNSEKNNLIFRHRKLSFSVVIHKELFGNN